MGYLNHVMRSESQGIERRSVAASREFVTCTAGNVVPEMPWQGPLSGAFVVEQIDNFHGLWVSRSQGCVYAPAGGAPLAPVKIVRGRWIHDLARLQLAEPSSKRPRILLKVC